LGDVDALVNALRPLIAHPDEARKLGSQLRDRARKHFSWGDMGDALMRIYRGIWENA